MKMRATVKEQEELFMSGAYAFAAHLKAVEEANITGDRNELFDIQAELNIFFGVRSASV